jgi:cell division protein FtsN
MNNKNYKRLNHSPRPTKKTGGLFKWMFITALLIGFVVSIVYIASLSIKKFKMQHNTSSPTSSTSVVTPMTNNVSESLAKLPAETVEALETQPEIALPPEAADDLEGAKMPQFDFYTILPEKDVAVPNYETTPRAKMEHISPDTMTSSITPKIVAAEPEPQAAYAVTKSNITYIMQAGSFKNISDAEKMRTNLASMGIDARIERAKVGEVVWNRVKIGPYAQMSSVSAIRLRLHQIGIEVIVSEIAGSTLH